jgi:MerR family transcriptional regulator, heat shock protein HspR
VSLRKRPVYMIGIASELIGVHPQTLRMYEQKGLIRPRKSIKNTRLYSQEDVDLGRYIQRLTQELGMNLAGVRKVIDLERQVARLEAEIQALREELNRKDAEHSPPEL